ncbi:hypothetical protein [Massilia aquatica]|uniref:Uncharacterized protein n=1 Tax=Massilia aquatica TaxID=2609000 RepID=A0ABX0M8Z6_9BURK|nr:hypothetical protein [Massilia aquatica]NHZ40621.1 hypothetical protein [Massilia aquatica]
MLSLVSTAYAIMAARGNALATERMMAEPLAKERLMSDWYGNTYAAIARTALIARSSDNTLSSTVAAPISDSVKRTTELIKKLEPLLASAEEAAAAAGSLEEQAARLADVAAGFKLGTTAAKPRPHPAVATPRLKLAA